MGCCCSSEIDAKSGVGCRRCCSHPHGSLPVYTGILSLVGLAFMTTAFSTCHFADIPLCDTHSCENVGLGLVSVGMYPTYMYGSSYGYDYSSNDYPKGSGYDITYAQGDYFHVSEYCYLYSAYGSHRSDRWDALLGSNWKAAMSFAYVALIVGFVMVILPWVATCRAFRQCAFYVFGSLYLLCSVSATLTFLMFATEVCQNGGECTFGWGAGMAVGAAVSWLAAAILSFYTPKHKDPPPPSSQVAALQFPVSAEPMHQSATQMPVAVLQGNSMQETASNQPPVIVEITETVQPDGSKIVEKVTTNQDGSKYIERTLLDAD
mmetsp:Transcript_14725/g.28202  ORF Transcript_14725/g.28202 Transcript_14725/m.28202 type:complete len:320 (-) Transcript_14725:127-1086(-)